jgi:hypothetical protein
MIEPIISFTCPEDDIASGCLTASSCLYPDPSDRNGFLQCDDSGQVYNQKCNRGLVWNDKIKNCDAPNRREVTRTTTEAPITRRTTKASETSEEETTKKPTTKRFRKPTIEEFL